MFTEFFRRLMLIKWQLPNLGRIVHNTLQIIKRFFTQTGLSKIVALLVFALFNWTIAFVYYAIISVILPQKARCLQTKRNQQLSGTK